MLAQAPSATNDTPQSLWELLNDDLFDRLADHKRTFEKALMLTPEGVERPTLPGIANLTFSYVKIHENQIIIKNNEDNTLNFEDKTFDLIAAPLLLPTIDPVPPLLLKLGQLLKPDGLLLLNTWGTGAFTELRDEKTAPALRFPACTDVHALGNLIRKLNFALPVLDRDTFRFSYPDVVTLQADMASLGPAGVHLPPDVSWQGGDLSLELITLTAYRPAKDQPQPLKPGQYKVKLVDALEAES